MNNAKPITQHELPEGRERLVEIVRVKCFATETLEREGFVEIVKLYSPKWTKRGLVKTHPGWPNIESRVEFGFGPRADIRGSEIRPLEIGVSGVVGQFRTTRTLLGPPASLPPRAVIDTWGIGSDMQWWISDCFGTRGEFYHGQGLGEYNGGILQSFNSTTLSSNQMRC